MNKENVSNLLISLWGCIDQANFQDQIVTSLKLLPKNKQIELIKEIIDHDKYDWEFEDEKLLERFKKSYVNK